MLRGFGFARNVHRFRRGALHAEGQFVGADAGVEFAVGFTLGLMLRVHLLDEIERGTLACAAVRALQMQDGIVTGTHGGALIRRGQEAAAPGGRAAFQTTAGIRQHDERGHVGVLGAEAIRHPASQARLAHLDGAGVHLIDRLRMIHAVAMATADDAHLIGDARHVRQEVADLDPALPMLPKRLHRCQQRVLRDFASRFDGAVALRQRFARMADEFGLRIEQIDVARPAVHEEPDHALRLRREMRARLGHQMRQSATLDRPMAVVPRRRRRESVAGSVCMA
jgi:hypothetical protein